MLAFPLESMSPGAPPPPHGRHGPPVHLGDVVIAPAYVGRQAAELAGSVADELALMVVHGVLHLMGYDHVEDDEAEEMEARERAILAAAGVVRR